MKGLIAGLWTLSLAFTLLFTVLYVPFLLLYKRVIEVISGFATMTIGRSEETQHSGLEVSSSFSSPRSPMARLFSDAARLDVHRLAMLYRRMREHGGQTAPRFTL